MPKIYPALPARSLYDLGPVLTEHSPGQRAETHRLLEAMSQLGADGFVQEHEELGRVYGVSTATLTAWKRGHPGLSAAVDVAGFLLTGYLPGTAASGNVATRTTYYRAFRYVRTDPVPGPATVPPEILPVASGQMLARAHDLREQFLTIHGLLAAGAMEPGTYQAVRAHLIAQLTVVPVAN